MKNKHKIKQIRKKRLEWIKKYAIFTVVKTFCDKEVVPKVFVAKIKEYSGVYYDPLSRRNEYMFLVKDIFSDDTEVEIVDIPCKFVDNANIKRKYMFSIVVCVP